MSTAYDEFSPTTIKLEGNAGIWRIPSNASRTESLILVLPGKALTRLSSHAHFAFCGDQMQFLGLAEQILRVVRPPQSPLSDISELEPAEVDERYGVPRPLIRIRVEEFRTPRGVELCLLIEGQRLESDHFVLDQPGVRDYPFRGTPIQLRELAVGIQQVLRPSEDGDPEST